MTSRTESLPLWKPEDMSATYVELEHPADIWLEVRADVLPHLFENGLYAFYSQIADLRAVEPVREVVLEATGDSVESAFRALLAEALFRFEVDGFLAAGAEVRVQPQPPAIESSGEHLRVVAHAWGESADRERHSLLAEVKAVTYHRLMAEQTPEGWRATVLLDV